MTKLCHRTQAAARPGVLGFAERGRRLALCGGEGHDRTSSPVKEQLEEEHE